MFFSIVETAASSIFYGVIATCAVMAILYFILKSVDRCIVKTFAFYLTGIALAMLLFIQFSLLSGAYKAKAMADSAALYMNQLVEGYDGPIATNDIKRGLDSVSEKFPIIASFIDTTNYSDQELSSFADTMHETIVDRINTYIWNRIWWIIGFVFVACSTVFLLNRGYPSNGHGEYFNLSEANGLQF